MKKLKLANQPNQAAESPRSAEAVSDGTIQSFDRGDQRPSRDSVRPYGLHPSWDICKVRAQLAEAAQKSRKPWAKTKKDAYLKQFIQERDIVSRTD